MTASELIALAKDAGLILKINQQGGLRVDGRNADEFVARYREYLIQQKSAILALLRGETPPIPDEDITRQARLEFALAFAARVEQEVDAGVPEWLEWAFWCLFADAMEGFVRWGLGEIWPQVQAAAEAPRQASEMRHRALEGWASWHRERERHRYSARWGNLDEARLVQQDQLGLECETWAWRAYLLELALKNPQAANESEIDPWVDLQPWAMFLAKNGRKLGLVWTDWRAA